MASPRVGLVGIGDVAESHALGARAAGLDLCIAAGRNPLRARALADRLSVPFYPSYEALLDDSRVDAVDLCVPSDLHRAYAEQAFAAGKHVLCEKPIALSLADADVMIAASERAGRVLMVGHVLRFWPEYRCLRDLCATGELGQACWLSARRLTGLLAATTGTLGWRADPCRCGGAVLDLQVHDVDFFCSLLGPPSTVFAQGLRSPSGSWDHVLTILGYPDGRRASVEASCLLQGAPLEISFQLTCRDRTVAYHYNPRGFALHGLAQWETDAGDSGASLIEYRVDGPPRSLLKPSRDSFAVAIAAEVAAFGRCVATAEPPREGTGAQARLALAVCLASLRACETGETQSGPF